jgi:uncharacterized protein (DUF2236 family)
MGGRMFDDRSAIRRVNGESILLLGGGRALLLQVAHPLVAAGVAEHSAFASQRFARMVRTLRPLHTIVFGTDEQARRSAEHIARRHKSVVGPGYSASDPELQVWVLATLIDTTLTMRARFIGPQRPRLEAAYYRDALRVGDVLGVPRASMPGDLAEFRTYFEQMLNKLEVTEAARTIAADLFSSRRLATAPAFLGLRWLTAGLLPATVREQYGYAWSPGSEAVLSSAARLSRAVWPRLPRSIRRPPGFLMPPP